MGRDRSKDEELSTRARALAIRKAPNINHFWARLMVEELFRNGVENFVISPGSRSTPLALAVAKHPQVRYFMHYDERGAGFFALGLAQRFGTPVALICTSGSAAANYWPAVVEASQSATPLLLLTADRPPELLDCGANQAIDQNQLYGTYVRWFVNMPCPTLEIPATYVLSQMDEAYSRSINGTAGPVHVNCPFREPLAPTPDACDFSESLALLQDWLSIHATYVMHATAELRTRYSEMLPDSIEQILSLASRPLIIVANRDHIDVRLDSGVFETPLIMPVFVDVLASDYGNVDLPPNVLLHGDLLMLSSNFQQFIEPDLIVILGGATLSKRLDTWINQMKTPILQVNGDSRRYNPAHRGRLHFIDDVDDVWEILAEKFAATSPDEFLEIFQVLEEMVEGLISQWVDRQEAITEIGVAWHVTHHIREHSLLFLGNSMPVRDMAAYGVFRGMSATLAANRGASGIDGNLATAAGLAVDAKFGLTIVLGDLAFLHDLNSLPLFQYVQAPVVIIVINNDGGGIFHMLPVVHAPEAADHFEAILATPHGKNFAGIAKTFGLKYVAPKTVEELVSAYQKAQKGRGKVTLIEVQTERTSNAEQHQDLNERILSAVEELFEEYSTVED